MFDARHVLSQYTYIYHCSKTYTMIFPMHSPCTTVNLSIERFCRGDGPNRPPPAVHRRPVRSQKRLTRAWRR